MTNKIFFNKLKMLILLHVIYNEAKINVFFLYTDYINNINNNYKI